MSQATAVHDCSTPLNEEEKQIICRIADLKENIKVKVHHTCKVLGKLIIELKGLVDKGDKHHFSRTEKMQL